MESHGQESNDIEQRDFRQQQQPERTHPDPRFQRDSRDDNKSQNQQQPAGSQPEFSLANPDGPNNNTSPQNNQGLAYVQPQYYQYNPQYGKGQQGPVWSLAQPLPHVVRDGMRHGELSEQQEEEKKKKRPEISAAEQPEAEPEKPDLEELLSTKPDERGFFNFWSKVRYYLQEPLAEWLGVTVAMTLGLCASLSNYTSQGQAGSFPAQSAVWGFGIMLGVYVAGGTSGGHLNPCITIPLSFWRGFPARKCLVYVLAQIIGGITAGGFAYAIYHDAIVNIAEKNHVPQNESPASESLLTMPKPFVHPATAFFTEFLGSAILVGSIFALGDDSNAPPGAGMQAFVIGILVSVLCLALGYNTGGCFNGARDFGPRLVCVMAGWGGHLFREHHAWWIWGPWIAGIAGGSFGAFIYDLTVFTGGESPINYPPRRWKYARLSKEKNLRNKLGCGRRKVRDIERAVKEDE